MRDLSDQQLIDLCVSGDRDAFSFIVRRYQDMVFAMCFRAVRNVSDAEDISQEVFIRVFRNLGSFKRDAPMKPWIYRITANRIYSFFGRRKNDREISADSLPEMVSGNPQPDDEVFFKHSVETLINEIADLPEHYRSVMTMWFVMGMSYQEIADSLGKPIGTIRAHLFRARKQLKEKQPELFMQLAQQK